MGVWRVRTPFKKFSTGPFLGGAARGDEKKDAHQLSFELRCDHIFERERETTTTTTAANS